MAVFPGPICRLAESHSLLPAPMQASQETGTSRGVGGQDLPGNPSSISENRPARESLSLLCAWTFAPIVGLTQLLEPDSLGTWPV